MILLRQANQDDERKQDSTAQRTNTVNTVAAAGTVSAAGASPSLPSADLNPIPPILQTTTTPSLPFTDAMSGPTVDANVNNDPATIAPDYTPISVQGNQVPGAAAII
jgi:hypothetical protein